MKELHPAAIVRQASNVRVMVQQLKTMQDAIAGTERLNLKQAVDQGKLLIELKALVEHGDWESMLERAGVPVRRAEERMQIASLPEPELVLCHSVRDALLRVRENAKPKNSKGKRQIRGAAYLKDEVGQEIPVTLRDVFNDPWLGEVEADIETWVEGLQPAHVMNLLKTKSQAYGAYLRTTDCIDKLGKAHEALESAKATVAAAIPYAVCRDCQGKGCDECRKAGWMPKWRYDELHGASDGSV